MVDIQVFRKKFHTHIHLRLNQNKISLLYKKNRGKKYLLIIKVEKLLCLFSYIFFGWYFNHYKYIFLNRIKIIQNFYLYCVVYVALIIFIVTLIGNTIGNNFNIFLSLLIILNDLISFDSQAFFNMKIEIIIIVFFPPFWWYITWLFESRSNNDWFK